MENAIELIITDAIDRVKDEDDAMPIIAEAFNNLALQLTLTDPERSAHCKIIADILEKKTKKNARNAGRKKADSEWTEKYISFINFCDQGMKMKEIMTKMDISRSTYYRYKSIYDSTYDHAIPEN